MENRETELVSKKQTDDLTQKKIDVLWEMYKLLDAESASLVKETLRCFIYASVLIAIPFGISKVVTDQEIPLQEISYMVPFAILVVYYYYLTLMYFVICIGIHKAGIEKKINALAEDINLLNYNSLFADKIYGTIWLRFYNKNIMPTPNVILAAFVVLSICTVTIYKNLLPSGTWLSVFTILCLFTLLVTYFVFFRVPKVVKENWATFESQSI